MEVYHASMVRVERPDVYHSRKFLDFGQGFYVTTLKAKPSSMPNALYGEERKLG